METNKTICEHRTRIGWTLQELADHLKVTRPAVVHWEVGRHRPSIKHRGQMAQLFGLPLEALMPEVAVS